MLAAGCVSPDGVYLTYDTHDTSSSIVVNWMSQGRGEASEVYYDTTSHAGDRAAYAMQTTGERRALLGKETRFIHSVALSGLEPDTDYFVVAGNGEDGYSREFKFRTLPNDGAPVRLIVGGDQGPTFTARQLLSEASQYEPHAVVIGGDIAYANGEPGNLAVWDAWFWNYRHRMETPDGYTVPLMLAIGNHEVNDEEGTPEEIAPWFYGLFKQADTPYFTRAAGAHTTLFFLDTGHTHDHEGAQRDWLAAALNEYEDVPNKLAVYHEGLFPSYRPFEKSAAERARKAWQPLFDAHGLDLGFEHHDHTFKRTKPIIGSEVDEAGTVYLGDGSFGIGTRPIRNGDLWYMEKASPTPHFWVIDLKPGHITARAVDRKGNVFDEYEQVDATELAGDTGRAATASAE